MSKNWGWVVAAGILLDTAEAAAWRSALQMLGAVVGLALVAIGVTFVVGRWIARPLVRIAAAMREIASGNLDLIVPDMV